MTKEKSQNSPVHPVSESMGGPLRMTDEVQSHNEQKSSWYNIGLEQPTLHRAAPDLLYIFQR